MEQRPSDGPRAALLAGAGAGTRLGRGPKAFLELAGRTLLEWAAAAFSASSFEEIVVAVPSDRLDEANVLLPGATLVDGGASRQETVLRMLEATDAELVLVHDVARPFLPRRVIEEVTAGAARTGAASATRPVADSLVRTGDGTTVAREDLLAVQTPQGFRRELLLRAHLLAQSTGRTATDDAGLVRALGSSVEACAGSPWLFKITEPEDLDLAEGLAPAWQRVLAGGR